MHSIRFPNETPQYREARFKLLEAERELRRQTEEVAEQRRQLPLGGLIPQDYVFHEAAETGPRPVRMSELFRPGKDTLVVYGFMYGPEVANACPACTSILDSLDGAAVHLDERISLAVVAKSPIERIQEHAKARGWQRLRLLSSAGTTFNHDYHAEDEQANQIPLLNVFVRRDGAIHHVYNTELFFAPREPGQDARHVDSIWPLWNVLDLTPEGRGATFYPRLSYQMAEK
jgi:predicted dithiol-disulfide oxidoreductase (DUF899 family)